MRKNLMYLANTEIRKAAKAANIPLWKIALELGISEATMTRKMRCELSEEEKKKVLTIINELHTERLNAVVERMNEEGVVNK